jgi:ribosome-associated translation inhibitor RaiA
MRLNLQHFSVRSTDALDSWIEQQLFALGRLRQIDEANVRLAHRREASPAYHVHVHLVTPGPDIYVEGFDHTVRAAFTKVMQELSNNILGRGKKRLQKVKSNLSTRGAKAPAATR